MAYTEVDKKGDKVYYYRVKSIRNGKKVNKKKIYLGEGLNKIELIKKEKIADKDLMLLNTLLSAIEIKELEKIKLEYSKQSKKNFENRYEAFCSLFAYDSTNIEGNTLTLQQTAQLLFEGITPSAKSLREINEVINHKEAFDFILNTQLDVSKKLILELHKIVVKNTLKEELEKQIGKYRDVQVYIRGVQWLPPKPNDVAKEMKRLFLWYSTNKRKLHPLILAGYFHAAFESIHPFADGNGRVGRLLMNFILHKNGFPMINILNSKRLTYYNTLEEAQVHNNLKPFLEFLIILLKEEKIRF